MSSAVQVFARFRPPNAMEVDSERRFGDEDDGIIGYEAVNCVEDHVVQIQSSGTKTNEFTYNHLVSLPFRMCLVYETSTKYHVKTRAVHSTWSVVRHHA